MLTMEQFVIHRDFHFYIPQKILENCISKNTLDTTLTVNIDLAILQKIELLFLILQLGTLDFLQIWLHLLIKSLLENFIFRAVSRFPVKF